MGDLVAELGDFAAAACDATGCAALLPTSFVRRARASLENVRAARVRHVAAACACDRVLANRVGVDACWRVVVDRRNPTVLLNHRI